MEMKTEPARPPRNAIVDATRGAAIALMFVYHFSWDLTYFGFADFGIFTDWRWVWFARFIAGLILLVMGTSQVLARARGRTFTARSFFTRLAVICGAAALVSAATYMMDPRSYVFFGILHHVALASVLLAGLIHLPTAALAGLGALCLAAPLLSGGGVFHADWLVWLGLSASKVVSVDYLPMIPWFGVALLGVVLGRWLVTAGRAKPLLAWQPAGAVARLVRWAGRHSLMLYLIHQPILLGILYGVAALVGTR
jgi:uncharacterized membrane protein